MTAQISKTANLIGAIITDSSENEYNKGFGMGRGMNQNLLISNINESKYYDYVRDGEFLEEDLEFLKQFSNLDEIRKYLYDKCGIEYISFDELDDMRYNAKMLDIGSMQDYYYKCTLEANSLREKEYSDEFSRNIPSGYAPYEEHYHLYNKKDLLQYLNSQKCIDFIPNYVEKSKSM